MFNVTVDIDYLQFGAIYIKKMNFRGGRGAPLAGRSAPPRQW